MKREFILVGAALRRDVGAQSRRKAAPTGTRKYDFQWPKQNVAQSRMPATVILNAVKNPCVRSSHQVRSNGFFTAFRMTGFVCFEGGGEFTRFYGSIGFGQVRPTSPKLRRASWARRNPKSRIQNRK